MGINNQDWQIAIDLFTAALQKHHVSPQARSEFLQIIEVMKGDIVEVPWERRATGLSVPCGRRATALRSWTPRLRRRLRDDFDVLLSAVVTPVFATRARFAWVRPESSAWVVGPLHMTALRVEFDVYGGPRWGSHDVHQQQRTDCGETQEEGCDDINATATVQGWLDGFGAALSRGDYDAATAMFGTDAYWRDLVSFTWNIKTAEDPAAIRSMLEATVPM
jgi:hypothetical protein